MRLLVYAFRPYGTFTHNISERVLEGLAPRPRLARELFAVRFDAGMFRAALAGHRPDVILGLGQHPRARKLRIERKARNIRERGEGFAPIDGSGPAVRFANLSLPDCVLTTAGYDAGRYVCNYSMYLMGTYCEESGGRFGFIHIPPSHDVQAVCRYLEEVMDQITHFQWSA